MRPRRCSPALGAVAAFMFAAAAAGCGSERHAVRASHTPPQLRSIYAGMPLRGTAGERVYERSGCAACHRIGGVGNDGPGPRLTHVGARLDRARLGRVLVDPRAPMPSFRGLHLGERRALVTFLARLR